MTLWWLPFLAAVVVAIIFVIAHFLSAQAGADKPVSYRKEYLSLVKRAENLSLDLNQLARPLASRMGENRLIDFYESCLRLFENLLTMFKALPPFGQDLHVVRSVSFLLSDCEQKVGRCAKLLKSTPSEKPIDLRELYGMRSARSAFPKAQHLSSRLSESPLLGCYFCSRPFVFGGMHRVKVKDKGRPIATYCCPSCRKTFAEGKHVKVLHFVKNGNPVHWSQYDGYNPIKDFWHIQRKTAIMKNNTLELVYSRKNDTAEPIEPPSS